MIIISNTLGLSCANLLNSKPLGHDFDSLESSDIKDNVLLSSDFLCVYEDCDSNHFKYKIFKTRYKLKTENFNSLIQIYVWLINQQMRKPAVKLERFKIIVG